LGFFPVLLDAAANAKQLAQQLRPFVEFSNELTNQIRSLTGGHVFHLSILLNEGASTETHRRSAEWLSHWVWRNWRRSANPRVNETIGTLQSGNNLPHNLAVHEYLDQVLKPEAVLLAASESKKPQKIRLGSQWIKGGGGKITRVSPLEIPATWYDVWFRQRSRAIYEKLVLDHRSTIIVRNRVRRVYEQDVPQTGASHFRYPAMAAARSPSLRAS